MARRPFVVLLFLIFSEQQITAVDFPNDERLGDQWALEKIQMRDAWTISVGKRDLIIAIIDTGIDKDHKDLGNKIWKGWNFIVDDPIPNDLIGHGTHIAGIIAAEVNNGEGIAGVAWNCRIMPIKVRTTDDEKPIIESSEELTAFINAMRYAVENGAHVINIALEIKDEFINYPGVQESIKEALRCFMWVT